MLLLKRHGPAGRFFTCFLCFLFFRKTHFWPFLARISYMQIGLKCFFSCFLAIFRPWWGKRGIFEFCAYFLKEKKPFFRVFMKNIGATGWSKTHHFFMFLHKRQILAKKIVKKTKIKKHEKVLAVPRQQLANFLFFYFAKKHDQGFLWCFHLFLLFSRVFFIKKSLFKLSQKSLGNSKKKLQKRTFKQDLPWPIWVQVRCPSHADCSDFSQKRLPCTMVFGPFLLKKSKKTLF